jgi:hypothetical protein
MIQVRYQSLIQRVSVMSEVHWSPVQFVQPASYAQWNFVSTKNVRGFCVPALRAARQETV